VLCNFFVYSKFNYAVFYTFYSHTYAEQEIGGGGGGGVVIAYKELVYISTKLL